MKKSVFFCLYLYSMAFLLPVLITILLSGTKVLTKYLSGEERFLPLLLAEQTPRDFPGEAQKAQAVLVRTNYEAARSEGESPWEYCREILRHGGEIDGVWGILGKYESCREAVRETNEILLYNSEPRRVPYHLSNNGMTRDGEEVFHSESYAYLISVESSWDRRAPSYLHSRFFPEDYLENLEIVDRDSAGYVLQVRAGEEVLSGEELRKQLDLPSSAFSFQRVENSLRILCKGAGYGLGMSQCGAQAMAETGSTYLEILNYYFPRMEIN